MLEKLEMHDIQDKPILLDEFNKTRDAVNEDRKAIKALDEMLGGHLKDHQAANEPKPVKPSPNGKPR